MFNSPTGLAVDSVGTLYVGDNSNHAIRAITTAGSFKCDYSDNIAFDCDYDLLYITVIGVVTTLSGTGTSGYSQVTPCSYNNPWGIALSTDNAKLFVVDYYIFREHNSNLFGKSALVDNQCCFV